MRQSRSTLQWANGRNLSLEKAFSVEIDPIKYWGANRRPMAASSNFRFPPYFYFRFGRKRPWDGVFRHFWPFLRTIVPDNSNQVNCTKWALVQCTVLSGPKWCRTRFGNLPAGSSYYSTSNVTGGRRRARESRGLVGPTTPITPSVEEFISRLRLSCFLAVCGYISEVHGSISRDPVVRFSRNFLCAYPSSRSTI